jgi:hypothetical protein
MPNDPQSQIDRLRRDLQDLTNEVYSNNFSASQDFNKYSRFNTRVRVPIYSTAPSTAEIGELYANSTNGKLYVCTAANTWTLVGSQT